MRRAWKHFPDPQGMGGYATSLPAKTETRTDREVLQVIAMLPKKRPPTHPGEMLLKEFLVPLGVSQKEFARHQGWTYTRLNEIINRRRNVSADSALALGEALKTGPEFWLNLQRDWDLWHAIDSHQKIPPLKKAGG